MNVYLVNQLYHQHVQQFSELFTLYKAEFKQTLYCEHLINKQRIGNTALNPIYVTRNSEFKILIKLHLNRYFSCTNKSIENEILTAYLVNN